MQINSFKTNVENRVKPIPTEPLIEDESNLHIVLPMLLELIDKHINIIINKYVRTNFSQILEWLNVFPTFCGKQVSLFAYV